MTTNEQKSIDKVYALLSEIRQENNKFKEDTIKQVEAIANKVEQKNLPYNLEDDIVKSVQASISKVLAEALGGYNSPLNVYAKNVVAKYQVSIEAIFNEIVAEGIQTPEFKQRVRDVLLHKIAKTITSGIDGSIDKTVNLMKQDAIFRSKLTLSVNTLVNEFLHPTATN